MHGKHVPVFILNKVPFLHSIINGFKIPGYYKSQKLIAPSFVIAPLDVVKIRLQLQTHPGRSTIQHHPPSTQTPLYKGTLQTLLRILREEGLTALWKGNIPAEALYITYSAVQFTAYRFTTLGLQSIFPTHPLSPPTESFIAGATAGAISTTATYPLDLLRTRFAAQGDRKSVV